MKNELKKDLERAKQTHTPKEKAESVFDRIDFMKEVFGSDVFVEYKDAVDNAKHVSADAILSTQTPKWRETLKKAYKFEAYLEREYQKDGESP